VDLFSTGRDLFQIGDFDRAEFYFRSYLEQEDSSETYFYLGLIMGQKNRLEDALEFYYKSVVINPEYGNPCNEIGIILLRMGKDKDAVFWLKKSIRCKQNDALHISLFNLATLYNMWNRPERSLQFLHKAMELQPEFPEAILLKDKLMNNY
jgi:tetratricopeptide (TPR) repeat protein